MFAVALVAVGTVVLAVLLAALLPGAGLIGAAVVVVLGIAAAVWLVAAGATGTTPSDVASRPETEHLGPGGPDDPR